MLFKLVQGPIQQLFKIFQRTFSAVQQTLVGVVQQLFKVVSATEVLVILVQQDVVQGCPEHYVKGCPTTVLRGNLVLFSVRSWLFIQAVSKVVQQMPF